MIRNRISITINKMLREDETTSYLELYGEGESYNYMRKHTKAKILSIDNDLKIGKKIKKENKPGTRFISLSDLCKEEREKFNVMWLDYCSTLDEIGVQQDLTMIPRIMREKGTLFMTIRMGRERQFDKGTSRDLMELGILSKIYIALMDNLIQVEWQCTAKYISRATTKGKISNKPMKVYKFTWKKVSEQNNSMPIPNGDLLSLASNL